MTSVSNSKPVNPQQNAMDSLRAMLLGSEQVQSLRETVNWGNSSSFTPPIRKPWACLEDSDAEAYLQSSKPTEIALPVGNAAIADADESPLVVETVAPVVEPLPIAAVATTPNAVASASGTSETTDLSSSSDVLHETQGSKKEVVSEPINENAIELPSKPVPADSQQAEESEPGPTAVTNRDSSFSQAESHATNNLRTLKDQDPGVADSKTMKLEKSKASAMEQPNPQHSLQASVQRPKETEYAVPISKPNEVVLDKQDEQKVAVVAHSPAEQKTRSTTKSEKGRSTGDSKDTQPSESVTPVSRAASPVASTPSKPVPVPSVANMPPATSSSSVVASAGKGDRSSHIPRLDVESVRAIPAVSHSTTKDTVQNGNYLEQLERLVLALNMELTGKNQADDSETSNLQRLAQRVIELNLQNLALREQLELERASR